MGSIRLVLAALLAGVVVLVAAAAIAQEPDGIRWETDLATARAVAADTGRPLMVVFR